MVPFPISWARVDAPRITAYTGPIRNAIIMLIRS